MFALAKMAARDKSHRRDARRDARTGRSQILSSEDVVRTLFDDLDSRGEKYNFCIIMLMYIDIWYVLIKNTALTSRCSFQRK